MTIATFPPSIQSPCNNICTVDRTSGLCMGCGRSIAEIADWVGMSDSERTRVMAELPQRLASLRRSTPTAT